MIVLSMVYGLVAALLGPGNGPVLLVGAVLLGIGWVVVGKVSIDQRRRTTTPG